ncbi:MAG: hypothetical protein BWY83_01991 [bacterium ADurb.Bin478]|nr:MAG: hypothetical protein BWY83_01991 [bacterium ADurb.Bin478]
MDEHRLVLADPVGAVGGLVLHGRIPPGIVVDDHVGAGQVQAGAAGLEADEKERDVGIAIELLHDLEPFLGGPVEIAVAQAAPLQFSPQNAQHGDELAEDQHAVAGIHGFVEQFEEQIHLGGGLLGFEALEFEQVEVAADLAQAQKGVEDFESGALKALGGDQVGNPAAEILEQGGIDLLLVRAEGAGGDALDLGGQFPGHILLQATQQEGAEFAPQFPLGQFAFGPALGNGLLDAGAKGFMTAKISGHQEVHDAPQVGNAVFNGRTGEHQAVFGAPAHHLHAFGRGRRCGLLHQDFHRFVVELDDFSPQQGLVEAVLAIQLFDHRRWPLKADEHVKAILPFVDFIGQPPFAPTIHGAHLAAVGGDESLVFVDDAVDFLGLEQGIDDDDGFVCTQVTPPW